MNQARFFAGISLIFVLIFVFSFCLWSFHLLISCRQHEQTWGKLCVSLFALIFRGLILQGEGCLAFGEFSSLRTHSGGAC